MDLLLPGNNFPNYLQIINLCKYNSIETLVQFSLPLWLNFNMYKFIHVKNI